MSNFTSYLLVFLMLAGINIMDTVRLISVMHGKKLQAGLIGGLQSAVYIVAVSSILDGPMTIWKIFCYGGGVATGIIAGMLLEKQLSIGYQMMQIYSREKGTEIANALHQNGHAATISCATGMKGEVCIIHCAVDRNDIANIQSIVEAQDPSAFITSEETTPLRHGYFRTRGRRSRSIAI